jgi:Tfp pilus assembly protein PilO
MHFWQRKQLIIVIIAVVAIAWFVFIAYLPLRQIKKMAEEDVMVQRTYWMKTDAEIGQLPQLRKQFEQLETAVADYEVQIPSTTQLGLFLQQMADVMSRCDLRDQIIEPGVAVTTNKLSCVPVNVKCTGKLRQVFEFFRSLEKFDRAVRVEEVRLSKGRDPDGEVQMYTKLYIYYAPVDEHTI